MRLVGIRRLALAAGLICSSHCLAAAGLRLRAVEGSGMVVSPGKASPRKIVVIAEDDAGKPLNGVTVRFRLPADGPSGHFPSGLSSESVVTAADGRATVLGIAWNSQPGRLLLDVSAVVPGDRAELEIPIEIGGRGSMKEPASSAIDHVPSRGGGKKWLLLAAAVGGAAAIGVVAAGSVRPTNPAAPVIQPPITPVSTPPVVGTPVIGIGSPGH